MLTHRTGEKEDNDPKVNAAFRLSIQAIRDFAEFIKEQSGRKQRISLINVEV
jgi:hypothetical protein